MTDKTIKEEAPVNSGGAGVAMGDAGAKIDTVAGHDKPMKKKAARRTFKAYLKSKK